MTKNSDEQYFREANRLYRAGKLQEAEQKYLAALRLNPDRVEVWTNYGVLLRQTGRRSAAIDTFRRALVLRPGNSAVLINLARALSDSGRFQEAVDIRRELISAQCLTPDYLRELCTDLRALGELDEVISLIETVSCNGPVDAAIAVERGLALLTRGDYKAGFRDFEYRFEAGMASIPQNLPWPRMQGRPASGMRLLIYPDQGLGDDIAMARFVPELLTRNVKVTMLVRPPLGRLFATLSPHVVTTHTIESTEAFDSWVPAGSLPHCLGIPNTGPPPPMQLSVPGSARTRAHEIVAPYRDQFRIGFCWTGNLRYPTNHRRSMAPEKFLAVAELPDVQLFSLYKGDDLGALSRACIHRVVVDACSSDQDLADTAGVIDAMDLVVSTDTAVVHLAASMGKPVWNLLAFEGFWLYGRETERTPWYPSMTLFRQKQPGDWDDVISRVVAALRARLAGSSTVL